MNGCEHPSHQHGDPNDPDAPICCSRCGKTMADMFDLTGILIVHIDSPIMATPAPGITLCADCGQASVEFMMPWLVDHPMYQEARTITGIAMATYAADKAARDKE